ncbi:hypothetical protein DVR12_12320 [Chitinophaga silvatica]|uniref:YD repeat-containing protein n=1 Tax=Chitinophaga silvatica TaxID=2282649 RepID=A0A3E1YA37_9BACT|nr:hypothetical protein [Chitinophaga silvatica]RFS22579.1 hypothetical protein DVR12_12320 [Chitinophaga silvatica]
MKLRYVQVLLLLFLMGHARAQMAKRELFPTPNAASLGLYGQIPVSLFSGLPEISIPLYQFKAGDLILPLQLSYHAASIKPSTIPTWVGLGWSLQAGGVISRIQNDWIDEFINYTYQEGNDTSKIKQGHFFNPGRLGTSSWATAAALNAEADTLFGSKRLYINVRKDLSPDEFRFDFMGMSGSFFMDVDGKWKIQCRQGIDLAIECHTGPQSILEPNSRYASQLKNSIIDFIITGPDGTKYTFGSSPTAIEYNRMGVGAGTSDRRDGGTVATSWYLTKMKALNGQEINLQYTRDGYQVISNCSTFGSEYGIQQTTLPLSPPASLTIVPYDDQLYIVDPVYLSKISGPNGSIEFVKSPVTLLDYNLQGDPFNKYWTTLKDAYTYEVIGLDNPVKSTYFKLDQIILKSTDNAVVQKYNFSYTSSATNRLFLDSMNISGLDNSSTAPYKFSYTNPSGLNGVSYSTLKVDHWGYFNNVDPIYLLFPSPPPPTRGYVINYWGSTVPDIMNASMVNTYTQRRSPVFSAMQCGLINKIVYPTGGFSEFIYEPHSYSKYINQIPIGVQTLTQDKPGGGVRIKQINSSAGFNSPVVTKKYFYTRNFLTGDTLSSGVLNSGQPQYMDEDDYTEVQANNPGVIQLKLHYRSFSSNNVLPLHYTNGNHITYTSVTEMNADSSFTVYNYTNHDNGYMNLPAVFSIVTRYSYNELAILQNCSNEIERGALLSESLYKKNKTLIKKTQYQYNDSSTRFADGIRRYQYHNKLIYNGGALGTDPDGNIQTMPFIRELPALFAINNYLHYPYLKSTIETTYDENGANEMVVTKNIGYDNYRNRKWDQFINSKKDTVYASYKYPYDSILNQPAVAWQGQQAMKKAHIINQSLENVVRINSNQSEYSKVDYQTIVNIDTVLAPANTQLAILNNPVEQDDQYLNYDNKGNILSYIKRDGIPTSIEWAYNKNYPVVKVLNALNTKRNFQTARNSRDSKYMSWDPAQFHTQTLTFQHLRSGTITLNFNFGEYPKTYTVYLNYTLTGPTNKSGTLCINGQGVGCPGTASIDFANMPAGNYVLSAYPNSNFSVSKYCSISFESIYMANDSTGIKEFFYEGFEEATDAGIISGVAHTGKKYINVNYMVPFTPPNNRSYIIQWWNLSGGKWILNEQPYTTNKVLTGPVDDVRVYPVDAQMKSYTYQPLIGTTSEIDTKGNTIYYEYDGLGRLKLTRDKDGNILKVINYQYQQPVSQ